MPDPIEAETFGPDAWREVAANWKDTTQLANCLDDAASECERLAATLAELETAPTVTCVSRDGSGTPLSTVKLLGDRDAVAAVVQTVECALAEEPRA